MPTHTHINIHTHINTHIHTHTQVLSMWPTSSFAGPGARMCPHVCCLVCACICELHQCARCPLLCLSHEYAHLLMYLCMPKHTHTRVRRHPHQRARAMCITHTCVLQYLTTHTCRRYINERIEHYFVDAQIMPLFIQENYLQYRPSTQPGRKGEAVSL